MHLPTGLALLLSTLTLTLASPSPHVQLAKRCSPRRDPDLPLGYLPPAPCWQTFDPACQPHLAPETEMTLDAKHGLAVVYGVSEGCQAQIAEELARAKDGRKNYGWAESEGRLTVVQEGEGGILVISGMGEGAVERYGELGYMN
ncbi:hypothetical protein C8A01DRAFT_14997 [Parachaetomium inaequale]|uniref:Uncharacterized protein n=1 Tax=Parachaetomium inaequale TaxID=2588326 RepID=A0AAN6ST65_9PEZI|nr:hypothetical protein C8A01DRAFT_14997 [Parachaetomium inaequale]